MKTKTLFVAMAAIALVGCSKDDNQVDSWNGEIHLSSGVTTQTRAFDGMNTQLPQNQTVAVYVDNKTTDAQLYGNNVLKAVGDGTFTGGTTMYFPADKSDVNIYAFHTSATLADVFPTTAITHAVGTDQRVADNYYSSDLLYAAQKEVQRTKEKVQLTFYHLLSKVQVAIRSGAGTPDLTGATVSIVGTRLKATFTPDKAADINNSTSTIAQTARAGMISLIESGNDAADITLSNAVTTIGTDFTNPVYNDAIIVPQTVAKDAKFIKVKLSAASGGSEFFYKIPNENGLKLESGKKYQYHITVNLTGLTVKSNVKDWDPVGAVGGSAEMDPVTD